MSTPSESLLLLSGGLDSAALAALLRPALCLAIDYGQRPAAAELRAAENISRTLNLTFEAIHVDLAAVGGGLLRGEEDDLQWAPSPEWWPYRNQLLVTTAAAVALRRGLGTVVIGSVAGDRERHLDGAPEFYERLDGLLSMQEGGIRVSTPVIGESSVELLRRSPLSDEALVWTFSCQRSNHPCGNCPGCWKRAAVLQEAGRLQVPSG